MNAVSSYNSLSHLLNFSTSIAKKKKSAILSGHNDTYIFLMDLISMKME